MPRAAAVSHPTDTIALMSDAAPGEAFPPILTTAQAAELLSVHVEYLRRMVREGRIPAHRFPSGREIRFHRDELIAWVLAQPGHDRSPSAGDRQRA
jgi:excisionase family DNA binding protein